MRSHVAIRKPIALFVLASLGLAVFPHRLTAGDLLNNRLSQPRVAEAVDTLRAQAYQKLSGGVFKSSVIDEQITRVLRAFQRTDLVDDNILFNVLLSSNQVLDGHIVAIDKESLPDVKGFDITISKGLIDLLSDRDTLTKVAGARADYFLDDSLSLLAAVLAHELGHAMNGDNEKGKTTTAVYQEFDADKFSVKLLAAAGFDPASMRRLLELLEIYDKDTSLRWRLAKMLDEHPKPRFRIANIEEEIELLTDKGVPYRKRRIRRDTKEKTSSTSVSGLERELAKPQYQSLGFREKLTHIDQYLLLSSFDSKDPMGARTIVRLVGELERLLESCKDLNDIDYLIRTMNSLEKNNSDIAAIKSAQPEGDTKGAFRRLKTKITDMQRSMVATEPAETRRSTLDSREVWGELLRRVKKAETPEQIESVIAIVANQGQHFKERFNRSSDSPATQLVPVVAERVLELTRNLETAIDFLQSHFLVAKVGSQYSSKVRMPGLEQAMARMLNLILKKGNVELGAFRERMMDPGTDKDRLYAIQLSEGKYTIKQELMKLRHANTEGEPLSADFRYGTSKKAPVKELPSTAVAWLVQFTTGDDGVDFVFNDTAKTRFTLSETLEMLEREQPSELDPGFWAELKKPVLKLGRSGGKEPRRTNAPRELGVQVSLIRDSLAHLGKTLPPAALAQLDSLAAREKAIVTGQIVEGLGRFGSTPPIRTTEAGQAELGKVPELSEGLLRSLSPAQKTEIFSNLLKLDVERTLRFNGKQIASQLADIEAGVEELVSGSMLPRDAADEYLETLRKAVRIAEDVASGAMPAVPEEFYGMRRKLRLMTAALNRSGAKLSEVLATRASGALEKLVDLYDNRASSASRSLKLFNQFFMGRKTEVLAYLKDPASAQAFAGDFGLMKDFSKLIARYEGLSDSLETQLPVEEILAREVYHEGFPGQMYTYEHRKRGEVTEVHHPDYVPGEKAAEDQRSQLPFGKAFDKFYSDSSMNPAHRVELSNLKQEQLSSLWFRPMYLALQTDDPIEALTHTLLNISTAKEELGYHEGRFGPRKMNEEVIRLNYTLLSRALELVQSKEQMDTFAGIYALYLKGHQIGSEDAMELLNADMEKFGDITAVKYREFFYDRFVRKLNQFGSWTGQSPTIARRADDFRRTLLKKFEGKVFLQTKENHSWLRKVPFIKKYAPIIEESPWYTSFFGKTLSEIATKHTEALVRIGTNPGEISEEELLKNLRKNTPWSQELDQSLLRFIKRGQYDKISDSIVPSDYDAGSGESASVVLETDRDRAVELCRHIRSLTLRVEAYEWVYAKFGPPAPGFFANLKNKLALFVAAKKAERIWGKETLDELRSAPSLYAAFSIMDKAWYGHARQKAAAEGKDRDQAQQLLLDLQKKYETVENPFGAEINTVFIERSRHRDELLEKYAKERSMNFEQLQNLEKFKSRKSESPYHVISKGVFEMLDNYMEKLNAGERVQVALYLSRFDSKLDPTLETKVKSLFYGTKNRKKAVRTRGFYLSLEDIRTFLNESHPEERAIAYRALFLGDTGISANRAAENQLAERLLMSDPKMPKYLRRIMEIYLDALNPSERATILTGLLSQQNTGALTGPEVIKLFGAKGGVGIAKLLQLIASHGFKLPQEYQDACESFKGDAQKVDKLVAIRWIQERLPADKFEQIKSFDQELGSGSLKIGYKVTLKDGRILVIKLARENVRPRIEREFEVLRKTLDGVMNDPDLRLENLPGILSEVERIIKEEIDFKKEFAKAKAMKAAQEARPFLVKWFGNVATVSVPEPLEGWVGDGILAEEFASSKRWAKLPTTSLVGWSKESLAQGAINETINELLAFANPGEYQGGNIILDIDPHEENQLGQNTLLGTKRRMIDIDQGQDVLIKPEAVRGMVKIVQHLYQNEIAQAVELSREYMILKDEKAVELYRGELTQQRRAHSDPIEAFTKTVEELELKGITLKPEYLYFQKLFATLVGLKEHIRDPNYMIKQIRKGVFLRLLHDPKRVKREFLDRPAKLPRRGRAGRR